MKRNYYVVFDASGSMAESKCSGRETKLAVAKSAFSEFADKLPMDANLGLLVFDGRGIRELIALGPFARVRPRGQLHRSLPPEERRSLSRFASLMARSPRRDGVSLDTANFISSL